ncbi:MAG: DNA integrity scanning protein DisA nucleotide-binding domain protein [Candidatus Saganbacteria bacterium]|nr:DNA integrity scanning protein DisA nucleotide-binding domain protein [Candidatus Saganbacteria bacterium]
MNIAGNVTMWLDVLDIFIVSILLYYILLWLRGTRALTLLRGVVFILIIYIAARFIKLLTITWLFEKFAAVLLIMAIILFQPELRRTLERLGRGRLFKGMIFGVHTPASSFFVRALVRSVEQLSEDKTGALIVIERNTGLNEYLESGIRMDALISAELLYSIFHTKSPLHDGAVIVQGERILGPVVFCLFPSPVCWISG